MDFFEYVYVHGNYRAEWAPTLMAAEQSVLLMAQLIEQKGAGYIPGNDRILAALDANAPSDVRVVIIGEGPYASSPTGHAFDSETGVQKSQLNIFKELERSIPGFKRPPHGCLMSWVDQGVMLLNKDLTTIPGKDRGHSGFSSGLLSLILQTIQAAGRKVIYLLWGDKAKSVADMLKGSDIILEAAHPSPMNTRGGFVGCNHFALVNQIFRSRGEPEIDWHIPMDPSVRPYRKVLLPTSALPRKLLVLKDSREDHL